MTALSEEETLGHEIETPPCRDLDAEEKAEDEIMDRLQSAVRPAVDNIRSPGDGLTFAPVPTTAEEQPVDPPRTREKQENEEEEVDQEQEEKDVPSEKIEPAAPIISIIDVTTGRYLRAAEARKEMMEAVTLPIAPPLGIERKSERKRRKQREETAARAKKTKITQQTQKEHHHDPQFASSTPPQKTAGMVFAELLPMLPPGATSGHLPTVARRFIREELRRDATIRHLTPQMRYSFGAALKWKTINPLFVDTHTRGKNSRELLRLKT